MRPALVNMGLFAFWLLGCTVHHHYGRPFAYGVRADDWVIEEQARSCAASCRSLSGEAKLLCVSRCPGFVTAEVATCRDVPDWEICGIGYDANDESGRTAEPARSRAGERIAVGTLRLLGTVATSLIEASLNDDDEDEASQPERKRRPSRHASDKYRPPKKHLPDTLSSDKHRPKRRAKKRRKK